MTEAQLRSLLTQWVKRLGLDRWDLELRIEECEDSGALMEAERSVTYERSVIRCQPWVLTGEIPDDVMQLELTPQRIEACLVHELLHCHTRDMSNLADAVVGQLHRDAYSIFDSAVRRAEEQLVDRLAVALVDAFSS